MDEEMKTESISHDKNKKSEKLFNLQVKQQAPLKERRR
jgi:hypothetical protein